MYAGRGSSRQNFQIGNLGEKPKRLLKRGPADSRRAGPFAFIFPAEASGTMKSREEQLTWAKQRALICVDMGRFSDAVAFLRADLDENPLTQGVVSSEHAMRGYKAAMDAALGRSSQALTEWIEGFQ
jgi:hypothetical protein